MTNIKIRHESGFRRNMRRLGRFLDSNMALYITIAIGLCAVAFAVYARFIEPTF